MRRYLPLLLLSFSLTAAAQVVVTSSGQATTGGPGIVPAQPQPQAIVPANVALPGSGPATGLPPAVDVNDGRTGNTISVFQPREVVNGTPVSPAPASTANNAAATGNNAAQENATANANLATADNSGRPLNLGIQNYVGGQTAAASTQAAPSLGDIARAVKARHEQPVRTITNESLGVPANGTQAQPQAQPQDQSQPKKQMSQNDDVLDRGDLAKVQAALDRHNGNASGTEVASARNGDPAAEYARLTNEAESAQASQPAGQNSANSDANASEPAADKDQNTNQSNGRGGLNEQLPASSSPLPLLALLGFAAATGGVAYRYGQR